MLHAFRLPVLFISMLLLSVTACNDKPADKVATIPVAIRYPDKGDFRVFYPLFRDRHVNVVINAVRKSGIIQEKLDWLNNSFNLPRDIIILFKESDTLNAFYNPVKKNIEFHSAFVYDFYRKLSAFYQEPELSEHVMNVVIFFLFHEMGHALIDHYHLAVMGTEENETDCFAVFLLTHGDEKAERALIDCANVFYQYGKEYEQTPVGDLDPLLWDEHSLDKKRFYNVLALLYGKDPVRHQYLITQGILPEDLTPRFVQNYNKIMGGWQHELDPYLKSGE